MGNLRSGDMVYWRPKGTFEWHFGYVTFTQSPGLIRMGPWNGASDRGLVVSQTEIEWRPYHGS